jgi:hypothetical protein
MYCCHVRGDLLVEEVDRDTKVVGHALESDDSVRLKQLLVAPQAHLAHIPATVLVQVTILAQKGGLDLAQCTKEALVVALVQALYQLGKRCEVDGHLLVLLTAERGEVDDAWRWCG